MFLVLVARAELSFFLGNVRLIMSFYNLSLEDIWHWHMRSLVFAAKGALRLGIGVGPV